MSKLMVLLVSAALVAPPLHAQVLEGSWNAEFRSARVHLNIRMEHGRGYSNYGRTFPMSELSAVQRDGRNISFELRRPAGVFRFQGVGSETRASGLYEFNFDPRFKASLEDLGFTRLAAEDLIKLAISAVSLDDVRYLRANVRDGIDTRTLIRMLDHGANPEFVRGIYAAGFSSLTAEQLVRTRDHGVDDDFIRGMRALDINLTLEEYVTARDHGVTPKFVRELRDLGFKNSFAQLVRAKDHGVDADYVREMSSAGLPELTLSDYIELHDHGVSPDFAFEIFELGYKNIEANDLRRLRDHGVTAAFTRRANKEAGRQLTVAELVRKRSRGEH
jgi:hypothetical protein